MLFFFGGPADLLITLSELVVDNIGICEPPIIAYCDFEKGVGHCAIVAKYEDNQLWSKDNVYYILEDL